jgi:uncharacterized C2H2 Zn-finger protein
MAQIIKTVIPVPVCVKCEKKFSSFQKLENHIIKKIACDRIMKCDKCDKIFKRYNDLIKHQNRKTLCEPIQGDPTKQTPDGSCHFCYKNFKSKYSLKNHYNVCKIKNGGMALLFKKVEQQDKKIKQLEEQLENKHSTKMIVHGNNQNIETQNIANHNNTIFNFTLINFDEGQEEIIKILTREAPGILSAEQKMDIPMVRQIQDRIIGLVMKVHRNPEQKELQNVYVTNVEDPKDNAFMYEEGNWKIMDWDKLNKTILRNLYISLEKSHMKSKQDKLGVMKHMFIVGGCGDRDTIERMSDNAISEMYLEIGNKLNFKTISL